MHRTFPVLVLLSLSAAGALSSCSSGPRPDRAQVAMATPAPPNPRELIRWTGQRAPGWKKVTDLMDEQKLEAAAALVEKMLAEARAAKNSEEVVRCLVRLVQLRTGLHGYETAVRLLREQTWPEDLLGSTALHLYYAGALTQYAAAYAWEIQKREKVDAKGTVDLEAWTREQIYDEAVRAYAEVWATREQLGELGPAALAEYLTPNNYPEGVRPTLRDAVTYLFAARLADTAGWRPEHENEVFRLDLEKHLAADPSLWPQGITPVFLADPSIHPLTRLTAALADLEAWHAGRKERAAALEAFSSRTRQLHARFTAAEDRQRLRTALEERLDDDEDVPWWSAGMATLARMVEEEDTPDALVRARALAQRGAAAFPDSYGGKQCRNVIARIEEPSYDFDGMAVDAPGQRSFAVQHRNVREVWLKAYPLDLLAWLERSDDSNLFPTGEPLVALLRQSTPSHTWKVDLPATPDYRHHRTYIVPPLDGPGVYALVVSAREDFRPQDNQLHVRFFQVSDLVVSVRRGRETEVMVQSGASGAPVAGAELSVYRRDWGRRGHRVLYEKTTDAQGAARLPSVKADSFFVVARHQDQLTVDPRWLYLWSGERQGDTTHAFVFTDRSVYRPLQTVHFKVIAYRGTAEKANWQTLPRTTVTVSLLDPNREEVARAAVTTNEYGTAAGTLAIPAGRMLGQWGIKTSFEDWAPLRVEEYKRPTFEAKLLDAIEPLRLNEPAKIAGEARYYFGLPVTNGNVRWRVERTALYPWWWHAWGWIRHDQAQIIASGTAALAADGTFRAEFVPEADERARGGRDLSYSYLLTADVTDEGGETRTASKAFRLGFVAVEARVRQDTEFLRAVSPAAVTIVRTDLNGAPAPGKGRWRLLALDGPAEALLPADQPPLPAPQKETAFTTEGDRLRPRWEPNYEMKSVLRTWADGGEQGRGDLAHDGKGEAIVKLPPLAAGAYRLRYETEDAFGATYETSEEILVAGAASGAAVGSGSRIALPALLAVEESSVAVGGIARIWAASGLRNQTLVLDVYRDGKRIERHLLESDRDVELIEIPITDALRGGFGVSLAVVRDHQAIHLEKSVFVPWDDKELAIELTSFRDRLRPGSKETWTVKVTNERGQQPLGKAVELLAYMYDRSLDLFAPHSPPAPLSLFPNRSAAVVASAYLESAPSGWIRSEGFARRVEPLELREDELVSVAPYGIGGPGVRRQRLTVSGRAMPAAGMRDMEVPPPAPGAPAPQESKSEIAKKGQPATGPAGMQAGTLAPPPAVELRTDFSETAFFLPHLVAREDGTAALEFTVPDSVTSWSLWVHGITRDLRSGSLQKEVRTVKDLMVRPYLPRFLREGDRAVLEVAVNNAASQALAGTLAFDLVDPATGESLLTAFGLDAGRARDVPFTVAPNGSTSLSFEVKTPARVGAIAVRVVATAGALSDGELRPLPVLPGRLHLAQSRFVALEGKARRAMRFDDMARTDDPTLVHDELVVTLDAQLFYSVLSALPYLVNYPYECTEQTLNRFLSTGIVSSLYARYPAIARMAQRLSARRTELEAWAEPDPNRKMALEETPWLEVAQGGADPGHELANILDARIARAQRDRALAELRKAQSASGGFPWWPGGPPSPWMTLYLLYGFSKGVEFGVEVPHDTIERAWIYLHRYYLDEIVRDMREKGCCWETVTFLNYILSNYPNAPWSGGVFPEAERRAMLDFSFAHWKEHSPLLKGYLALTLERRGRPRDAALVWESVMDSAKSAEDQGTFWAPEERAWLWYNDTIETHAFAIRTTMELTPAEPKLGGLVQWILLNKKLNHWKSTRATAEVLYSLAHYLQKTEQLAVREAAVVHVGPERHEFVFEPDAYTGKKNQIVVPGDRLDPKAHAVVTVEKETKGHLFASATWHFSTERLPSEDRGDYLQVSRTFYKRETQGREAVLRPLAAGETLVPGDEVEVQLSLRAKHPMEYVHLRAPRGAGFEPVTQRSTHRWDYGLYWYEEVRDSGENFFFEHMPQGEFTFKYRLRAALAGTYKIAPATVQPMYAPEFAAYSAGQVIEIAPAPRGATP